MGAVGAPIDWSNALTDQGYGSGAAAPRRSPGMPGPIDWSSCGLSARELHDRAERRREDGEAQREGERQRSQRGVPRVVLAPPEVALPALVTPIYGPGGLVFTLQMVFDALRNAGVTPHGTYSTPGEGSDELLAQIILSALGTVSTGATEAGVTPSPALAIDEGLFPHLDPTDPTIQAPAISRVGNYVEMIADLARMGVGRVRRARQCDIYWASLFPAGAPGVLVSGDAFDQYGSMILRPDEMATAMRADGYAVLGWATGLIVACLCFGVKLDLTPFNAGGGATLNLSEGDITTGNYPVDVPYDRNHATTAGYTYADVLAGKRSWQAGVMISSGDGWDPWYHEALGSGPSTYQKLAHTVWPISPDEASAAPAGFVYNAAEGATTRRKCLGLATFSSLIGEWLERINVAFAAIGTDIYQVVEVIELCNEATGFYYTSDPSGAAITVDTPTLEASALEAGRYVALMAGPIRARLPSMRFRLEVASWAPIDTTTTLTRPPIPDQYSFKLDWLERVVRTGMRREVARWHALAAARRAWLALGAVDIAATGWFKDELNSGMLAAGLAWPVEGDMLPRAAGLIHQVGTHWFHDANFDTNGRPQWYGYTDAVRLVKDVDALRARVARLAVIGCHVRPVMMAMNFPAVDPGPPVGSEHWSRYGNTDGYLQAGMLVRHVATALASGAESVGIFNFAAGFLDARVRLGGAENPTSFQGFSSDGVHNDLYYAPATAYTQAVDGWARPAWYALRRLIWLYAQLGARPRARLQLLSTSKGLTVVGFHFTSPLHDGPDGAPLAFGARSRGYLAWLDQYASDWMAHGVARRASPHATLHFSDPSAGAIPSVARYELVSMVPVLGAPTSIDGNGYASATAPNWTWPGFADALRGEHYDHRTHRLSLQIGECDPDTPGLGPPKGRGIAPLLILTNFVYAGSD